MMIGFNTLIFPLVLGVVQRTLQVDVTLNLAYYHNPDVAVTCTNLIPGVCCKPPFYFEAQRVEFRNLLVGDIAAVWGAGDRWRHDTTVYRGCTLMPIATQNGPGPFVYSWFHGPGGSTGASFIRLPKRLPVEPFEQTWLQAEGMRGLVWGGGTWFSQKGVPGFSSNFIPKMRMRRAVKSSQRGTAYAEAPLVERYANMITINGTTYNDNGLGRLVYRSPSGAILNLTSIRP